MFWSNPREPAQNALSSHDDHKVLKHTLNKDFDLTVCKTHSKLGILWAFHFNFDLFCNSWTVIETLYTVFGMAFVEFLGPFFLKMENFDTNEIPAYNASGDNKHTTAYGILFECPPPPFQMTISDLKAVCLKILNEKKMILNTSTMWVDEFLQLLDLCRFIFSR